jgi:hypothetical protein
MALLVATISLTSVVVATASPARLAQTVTAQVQDIACGIPQEWLLRMWRGHMEGISGEIQLVVNQPDYIGSGLPHVGPWPYVQDIPMFWYGPGHVAAEGEVQRPVTLAGIAPTQADMMGFDFKATDGTPMDEVLVEGADRPKLIVTLVWDAAGMNVLDHHPDAWPFLKSLIPKGTWFDNATVGTTPTSTAQTHAVIGTGAFPMHHGITGHRLRIGGEITTPWHDGPLYFQEPTLADVYDHAMGNEPLIGEIGTVAIHLGMLGHGAMYGGGDRDIAVIRQALDADTLGDEGFEWNLTNALTPYYEFPTYLNEVGGFDEDLHTVDAADGRLDGKWRSNDMASLLSGFDTPARIPYQNRVLMELIERERFGKDDVPDMLFANFKMIDYISHVWTVNSPEMRDAVQGQDEALRDLVRFLDEQVGKGEWAFVLTADHGSIPDPDETGALSINPSSISAAANARFDTDGDDVSLVTLVQTTTMFVNEAELIENGGSLEELSTFLMTLTKGDLVTTGLPADAADDPAFHAVFPSRILSDLPCLPAARGEG